jgi:hypothetical protein
MYKQAHTVLANVGFLRVAVFFIIQIFEAKKLGFVARRPNVELPISECQNSKSQNVMTKILLM